MEAGRDSHLYDWPIIAQASPLRSTACYIVAAIPIPHADDSTIPLSVQAMQRLTF